MNFEIPKISDMELERIVNGNATPFMITMGQVNYSFLKDVAEELLKKRKIQRELVALLPAGHEECEDPWYSCPKAEGYIGNQARDYCNCGLDRINETLERLGIKR